MKQKRAKEKIQYSKRKQKRNQLRQSALHVFHFSLFVFFSSGDSGIPNLHVSLDKMEKETKKKRKRNEKKQIAKECFAYFSF